MARTRRDRPELTESWDDVEEEFDNETPTEDDDVDEEDDRQGRYSDVRKSRYDGTNGNAERRRATRSSDEPELVMPASPNATGAVNGKSSRAKTPHFRMNQRSMTSDAGKFSEPSSKKNVG